MVRWISPLAVGLVTVGVIGAALPVHAQDNAPAFADVPANHWAYTAVQELAKKGYVQGDPDGKFHGQREMTRYEFATVISRMLKTITELNATIANQAQTQTPPPPPVTPTGNAVTQDDLNKLQALVDAFKEQLEAIGTPIAPVQDQIDAIRQDILEAKSIANTALNTSYGFGSSRKFQITGYVQARFQSADSGNQAMFPQGLGAITGATGSFNGNYAVGGTKQTFVARRARLKATGSLTANSSYAIQIDAGGFTTNNTSPNNVTVREANVNYTFGDGNPDKNFRITAGLFANYFGYELPLSSADILAPERPLAFNEGGSGLFINQDYDRGVNVAYNHPLTAGSSVRFVAGLVNGTGLNGLTGGGVVNGAVVGGGGNDDNNYADQIYRLAYLTKTNTLGFGASFYEGRIPRPGIVANSNPAVGYTGSNYQEGKKELYGFDVHYNAPSGLFLLTEYIGGTYDFRSYFTSNTSFKSDQYAPGNKVEGYYFQGGWTFAQKTAHPLTFGASYDVFNRSKSGIGHDALEGGGASGSTFKDENIGYGVLYNLDKQTRLKLWYEKPNKVAHAANVVEPTKVGLATAELQVKF